MRCPRPSGKGLRKPLYLREGTPTIEATDSSGDRESITVNVMAVEPEPQGKPQIYIEKKNQILIALFLVAFVLVFVWYVRRRPRLDY